LDKSTIELLKILITCVLQQKNGTKRRRNQNSSDR
jgi:hypothetical protein